MPILTLLKYSAQHPQNKNFETGQSYSKTRRICAVDTVKFRSLKKLARLLCALSDQTSTCVIRGLLKQSAPDPLRRRRTHFEDAAQLWVMLDIDSLKLPKHLRTNGYTDAHAEFAIAQLPAEFQGVACVWQASASAGKDPSTLKMHLWFLLSAPLTAAQLRNWLGSCGAIDPSTLRCVQPHYTAAPIGAEFYVGPRIGRVRGPLKCVSVDGVGEAAEYESTVEMAPRPAGAADVSAATINRALEVAEKRARECLNNCTVAYQTAYQIGALVGPSEALQSWNDVAEGHESWRPHAATSAALWGVAVASVPGATHDADFYAARVMQGIVWGVARERERRAAQSQKALDAAISSTAGLRARLVKRLAANAGSETVLKQVGFELGRYAAHVDRAHLVAVMQEASGFSEQQVSDALDAGAAVEIAADAWREDLALTGKHNEEIVACDANLLRIYYRYPGFINGFRLNVRTKQLEGTDSNVLNLVGVVDFELLPGLLVEWLAALGCAKVSLNVAIAAFRAAMGSMAKYDPFLELYPEALLNKKQALKALRAVEPKLDTWLTTHFGCADKHYTRLIAAKTLIAAVARAVQPGCQVDTMLVLQGAQGIGKTQVLRKLGAVIQHGYQELLDMRDKDALLTMNDGLVVEVSELRALRYQTEETTKAFFSRQRDRIRAPYARTSQDYDRRIVFVGTTNDPEFLSDKQNRRYWPAVCTQVCRMNSNEADALWREAALRYAAGELWWLEGEEQRMQEEAASKNRYVDIIEEKLRPWLRGKTQVTMLEVCNVLFPDVATPNIKDRRIGLALRVLGWRSRQRSSGSRVWERE